MTYKAGTNVVVLEDDVAEAFPDSTSVNRALRLLIDLAKKQVSSTFPLATIGTVALVATTGEEILKLAPPD